MPDKPKTNADKLAIKVFEDAPVDVKLALSVLRDAKLTVDEVAKAYQDLLDRDILFG